MQRPVVVVAFCGFPKVWGLSVTLLGQTRPIQSLVRTTTDQHLYLAVLEYNEGGPPFEILHLIKI
jgi:hypothetical protein